MIQLHCPHCHQVNGVHLSLAGRVVGCAHCGQQFTVPVQAAAPAYQPPSQPVVVHIESREPRYPPKSRLAFILLAFFLGGFGIHNFYIGNTGLGLVQLLITLFTCGFAWIVVFIWNILELILVDEDSDGRRLR